MAWIREGSDVTTSSARLFLALLWNTTGARSPGHRHTPPLTHHLTGLFLTTSPISYTVSAVGTLLQPSSIPLTHKKHTLLHLLTYLQLHSSTVTRSCRRYHFFPLLPLVSFSLFCSGEVTHCNCLLCVQLLNYVVARPYTHSHTCTLACTISVPFFFPILQIKLFPVKHLRRKHQRSKSSQIC